MKNGNSISPLLTALILIVLAALTRFIDHPHNFTAIGAIALFAGATFRDKRLALILPFVVMLLTDLYFGFHFSMIPVYLCFLLTVYAGIRIGHRQTPVNIGLGAIITSVIFFLVTNLPFWYMELSLYPPTLEGTLQSYAMALPFFKNQLAGDLFYSAVLFGTFRVYSVATRQQVEL